MRAAIVIVCVCGAMIGCAMVPRGFHALWMQSSPPPRDLAGPVHFKITPFEAYTNLYRADHSYADTSRHSWRVYVDDRSYYFFDAVSNSDVSLRRVYVDSIQIEGQQGLIFLKQKHRPY